MKPPCIIVSSPLEPSAFHLGPPPLPAQVILKKEVAEQYISMGFIGAALKTLEELELWDSLITCYRLLEKKNMVWMLCCCVALC